VYSILINKAINTSLLHLAVESHDLSQAEQIHKMTTVSTKNYPVVILIENSGNFVNLIAVICFLSLR
jgi:D-arabinose 5-phosphate isomerase GutQ